MPLFRQEGICNFVFALHAGRLYVTSHNGEEHDNESRVNVYDATSGNLILSIQSPLLDHPNMMAVE